MITKATKKVYEALALENIYNYAIGMAEDSERRKLDYEERACEAARDNNDYSLEYYQKEAEKEETMQNSYLEVAEKIYKLM